MIDELEGILEQSGCVLIEVFAWRNSEKLENRN
jgi:hypothetical protein